MTKTTTHGPWTIVKLDSGRWQATKYMTDDPVPVFLWAATKKELMQAISWWIN